MFSNKNYGWFSQNAKESASYIDPKILKLLPKKKGLKILDLGCGNGAFSNKLGSLGYEVIAVDVSDDGIKIAEKEKAQNVSFHCKSFYDDNFKDIVGANFDVVLSTEVIEHLFWPKLLFKTARDVLKPGGLILISTPYHGYFKNLILSLINGWDNHFDVQWDGGHIKFFSKKTLIHMMKQSGFKVFHFSGAGRIPFLWKSMILGGIK